MTKRTLIERMERRKAPKSWIAEIEKMLRERDTKTEMINEFANLIDVLAREKETLITKLDVAHYQIIRAVGQLQLGLDPEEVEFPRDILDSVAAQLEAYLRAVKAEPFRLAEVTKDAKTQGIKELEIVLTELQRLGNMIFVENVDALTHRRALAQRVSRIIMELKDDRDSGDVGT